MQLLHCKEYPANSTLSGFFVKGGKTQQLIQVSYIYNIGLKQLTKPTQLKSPFYYGFKLDS